METLRNYLDSMFERFEKNDVSIRAKAELETMMEEKYNELISKGKSKHEAIGIVISEFGDVSELDLSPKSDMDYTDESKLLNKNDFIEFEKVIENSKSRISLGISAIILGIALMMLILSLNKFGILKMNEDYAAGLGMVFLFIMIALGVYTLIATNTGVEKKKSWEDSTLLIIPREVKSLINERIKKDRIDSTRNAAMGVPVIIISSILPAIFGIFTEKKYEAETAEGFILLGIFLMMLGITLGVYILTRSYSSEYNKLLVQTSNLRMEIESKSDRIISVIWIFAVGVYLLLSFLTKKWQLTWIVFPIAGLASAIASTLFKKKD